MQEGNGSCDDGVSNSDQPRSDRCENHSDKRSGKPEPYQRLARRERNDLQSAIEHANKNDYDNDCAGNPICTSDQQESLANRVIAVSVDEAIPARGINQCTDYSNRGRVSRRPLRITPTGSNEDCPPNTSQGEASDHRATEDTGGKKDARPHAPYDGAQ